MWLEIHEQKPIFYDSPSLDAIATTTSFGLANPKFYSSYQQEPTFPLCFGIEQIEVAHLRRSTA